MNRGMMIAAATVLLAAASGCSDDENGGGKFTEVGPRPDELPVMLNKELPFRYPPSLYSRKVQANVTLRVS